MDPPASHQTSFPPASASLPSLAAAGLAQPPPVAARSGQRARWRSSSSRSSREWLASCRCGPLVVRLHHKATTAVAPQPSPADPPHKARPLHQYGVRAPSHL
ncbi:hypothetical protein BDA96_K001200 [Sorghum bicolor]|uniref:Uncharacterized protein n=1 Tax=Sorghum bicolor TaxID=4558 RepID=A0A921PXK1_SORBI|nr:hypothetical protein BDA96_K001200 [Sorghum bicolor]